MAYTLSYNHNIGMPLNVLAAKTDGLAYKTIALIYTKKIMFEVYNCTTLIQVMLT